MNGSFQVSVKGAPEYLCQLRYKDAGENQGRSQKAQNRDLLVKEENGEHTGGHRRQGTEASGPLCGHVTLCHRLQGQSEGRAEDNQSHDASPLDASLGQSGCLEEKRSCEADEPEKTVLQNTQFQGIILSGKS